MSDVTETQRLLVRNKILAALEEIFPDRPNGVLATLLSWTLVPVISQILAEGWDEGYEAFAQQFVTPLREDGTREPARNPYRASLAPEVDR